MELLFAAKLMAELALYFAFANFFPALLSDLPVTIAAGSAVSGRLFHLRSAAKGWRAADGRFPSGLPQKPASWPICPFYCPLSACTSRRIPCSWFCFLPPWAYLIQTARQKNYQITYAGQHARFILGLKILPFTFVPVFFSLRFSNLALFERRSLPFCDHLSAQRHLVPALGPAIRRKPWIIPGLS